MKLKKLMDSITELTQADRGQQQGQLEQLKSTLKQLRNKCRDLRQDLAQEDGPERRQEIGEKLKIITAQRTKGLAILKGLQVSEKTDK